ncbi:MAG: sulfur carrier protein ThiS [Leptospirales bacterium]|nr:sulfur carrier protein ThiS [Leptospirales bacterium]
MIVNGKAIALEVDTLTELLEKLEIKPATVAIEINGEIPRRETWGSFKVNAADRIEIIKFVGGG